MHFPTHLSLWELFSVTMYLSDLPPRLQLLNCYIYFCFSLIFIYLLCIYLFIMHLFIYYAFICLFVFFSMFIHISPPCVLFCITMYLSVFVSFCILSCSLTISNNYFINSLHFYFKYIMLYLFLYRLAWVGLFVFGFWFYFEIFFSISLCIYACMPLFCLFIHRDYSNILLPLYLVSFFFLYFLSRSLSPLYYLVTVCFCLNMIFLMHSGYISILWIFLHFHLKYL